MIESPFSRTIEESEGLVRFTGVHPVLQLPLDSHGEMDSAVVRKEVGFVHGCGAQGVSLAMVSEVTRLSENERLAFLSLVVDAAVGRGEILFSVVAESERQACSLACHGEKNGATALIVALPLTYPVPPAAQYNFFSSILESTSLPIIIQDSSGYLGFPVSIEEQLRIYQDYARRVMFKPEAHPVGPMIERLLRETNNESIIFDGTGGRNLIENHARGVRGVLPGADMPWAVTALWDALINNHVDKAMEIQGLLAMIFMGMISLDSYLAVEKMFLRIQGVFQNEDLVRPAKYVLDDASRTRLLALLRRTAIACQRDMQHWKLE